jgi:hypothetical protein
MKPLAEMDDHELELALWEIHEALRQRRASRKRSADDEKDLAEYINENIPR